MLRHLVLGRPHMYPPPVAPFAPLPPTSVSFIYGDLSVKPELLNTFIAGHVTTLCPVEGAEMVLGEEGKRATSLSSVEGGCSSYS